LSAPDRDDARKRHNQMIVDRINGVPAQPATPESDADPRNPNEVKNAR
jgi:hypothetical protein